MQTAFVCNSCQCELPTSTQILATHCGHAFCLACAEGISAAGRGCPVQACGQALKAENVSVTRIRDTDPSVDTILLGMSKKDILRVRAVAHF